MLSREKSVFLFNVTDTLSRGFQVSNYWKKSEEGLLAGQISRLKDILATQKGECHDQ
jgi:hypothetical protein